MVEPVDKQPKVTVEEFVYFKMGIAAANLHAHGLTMPPKELVNLNNYILSKDDRVILSPICGVDHVVELQPPTAPVTEHEIIDLLLPIAEALPERMWIYFGAGYLKESEGFGRAALVGAACRQIGQNVRPRPDDGAS